MGRTPELAWVEPPNFPYPCSADRTRPPARPNCPRCGARARPAILMCAAQPATCPDAAVRWSLASVPMASEAQAEAVPERSAAPEPRVRAVRDATLTLRFALEARARQLAAAAPDPRAEEQSHDPECGSRSFVPLGQDAV